MVGLLRQSVCVLMVRGSSSLSPLSESEVRHEGSFVFLVAPGLGPAFDWVHNGLNNGRRGGMSRSMRVNKREDATDTVLFRVVRVMDATVSFVVGSTSHIGTSF